MAFDPHPGELKGQADCGWKMADVLQCGAGLLTHWHPDTQQFPGLCLSPCEQAEAFQPPGLQVRTTWPLAGSKGSEAGGRLPTERLSGWGEDWRWKWQARVTQAFPPP